jgi:hypothetical protein
LKTIVFLPAGLAPRRLLACRLGSRRLLDCRIGSPSSCLLPAAAVFLPAWPAGFLSFGLSILCELIGILLLDFSVSLGVAGHLYKLK